MLLRFHSNSYALVKRLIDRNVWSYLNILSFCKAILTKRQLVRKVSNPFILKLIELIPVDPKKDKSPSKSQYRLLSCSDPVLQYIFQFVPEDNVYAKLQGVSRGWAIRLRREGFCVELHVDLKFMSSVRGDTDILCLPCYKSVCTVCSFESARILFPLF